MASSRALVEFPAEAGPADLEGLYRQHFAFVWRSIRRLGVPERNVPDAAQEVFLVVARKLHDFAAQGRVTTWLYAICLRVASDHRRRAAERYELLGEEPPARVALTEPGDVADRRALLEAALDAMPLEQRAVFTLFELEGMTGGEIAALLEVPESTVHSRLRLARETFRRTVNRAREHEAFNLTRLGMETP
jgi:RNA polymerase sigma-70 factor (ECF subfamily)